MAYSPSVGPNNFTNALPAPFIVDARMGGSFALKAVQMDVDLGLGLGAVTPMWVYEVVDPTSGVPIDPNTGKLVSSPIINPTILTTSGVPISVTWFNDLPMGPGISHLLPYDPTLIMHMGGNAMPGHNHFMAPIVTHLHGGHTAAIYDGFPTHEVLPSESTTYIYDNSQEGAFIWYHDHSMGLTRLNVYAGLAGTYIIEDANRQQLTAEGVLPPTLSPNDNLLVIQDKSFNADGSLYYPAYANDPLPGTPNTVSSVLPPDYVALGGSFPTAVPEYYGDTILVNGTAWPHTDVAKGNIEYEMLNGSDSRFYVLQLDNPNVKVTLLGVDGGLLQHPIVICDGDGVQETGEQIVLAPADRVQLMFDFTNPNIADGTAVHLLNVGPAYEPFKGLNPDGTLNIATAATAADPVGQIMEFRVNNTLAPFISSLATTPADQSGTILSTVTNDAYSPIQLTGNEVTRKLGVFEYADQFGRIMPVVGVAEQTVDQYGNSVSPGGLGFSAPTTELVSLKKDNAPVTEVWELYNVSADAHPIHVHQIEYQVLGRYQLTTVPSTGPNTGDTNGDGVVLQGVANFNNDFGNSLPLYPEDQGNQDTVWLASGEGLKIAMTFDRPGDYLWHCHIVSHEDWDMMRPLKVLGLTGDFSGAISEDATNSSEGLLEIGRADPMMQGFESGSFTGSAGLGILQMNENLISADGMAIKGGNDGQWSYAVNNSAAQYLAQGQSVDDIITIHELDGTSHDITMHVVGVNDAPVVSDIATINGQEELTVLITADELLSRTSDVDQGAQLSIQNLWAESGLLTDNGNGTWTYTPDYTNRSPVTFSYSVTDGIADPVSAMATYLFPANLAPVVTGDVTLKGTSVAHEKITTAELLGNAKDPNIGNIMSVIDLKADRGILTDNGNGTWDYQPDYSAYGTSGHLTYFVSDGIALTAATATFATQWAL